MGTPPPCRPAPCCAHAEHRPALRAPVMEDEEEVQGMLPPVAPSLESRSKRKKTPSAMGNRGGLGQGRGSADTDTHIEPLAEDEDNGENFDMNDASAISLSVPTDDDDADGDASQ
ncbi:hypothetical protein PVAP13_8NG048302 [Panicum virgatum]|uniref:Uncharacterized protein n=1 Tax=Panicum virgatum TaxID=38727 RepID=A0A8T0P1B7_PANVG|nr:hypothetical protein PVAP13_8NG048302 [Panicum virgatum]